MGPLYDQSSSSAPSSSPGGSRSSSGSLCSWNSGVTCLLHSSIKRQSQEAFQTRLEEGSGWGKRVPCAYNDPHGQAYPQAEQGGGNHQNKPRQGRASKQTRTGSKSVKELLEERFKAKLKFSQFLDEVASNVLDPNCLQAFGKPQSPPGEFITNSDQPEEEEEEEVESWRLHDSMALQQNHLSELEVPKAKSAPDWPQRKYLETDIDAVCGDDGLLEIDETSVIPPPLQFSQGFKMTIPSPDCRCDFPRPPFRSASLPRGINVVSDGSCEEASKLTCFPL